MSDDLISEIVDQSIDASAQADDHTLNGQEESGQEQEAVEEAQVEEEGGQQDTQQEEIWPKKAVNALNRHKKQNQQLQARMHEMQLQQQRLEERLNSMGKQETAPKKPSMDDFNTIDEYVEAVTAYKVEETLRSRAEEANRGNQQRYQQEQQFRQQEERVRVVGERARELAKDIPDLQQTIAEYDGFERLPPQVQTMIMNAREPSIAAYNLIKSGEMDRLSQVDPFTASAMILDAQRKPVVTKKTEYKPVRGLSGSVGKGGGGIGADSSFEDLRKFFDV